ncbi:hypothetical protein CYMTET_30897, partial [Cymbomonas tetramitiformis]
MRGRRISAAVRHDNSDTIQCGHTKDFDPSCASQACPHATEITCTATALASGTISVIGFATSFYDKLTITTSDNTAHEWYDTTYTNGLAVDVGTTFSFASDVYAAYQGNGFRICINLPPSPPPFPPSSPTTTTPTTVSPTSAPTTTPTDAPTTTAPTAPPSTDTPTATRSPSAPPTTSAPTTTPTTTSPTTASPTGTPTTDSPVTSSPSSSPTTAPTTNSPTASPSTANPTT